MNKQHPPHLPPKSCSLKQRNTLQTLPWLLVFAVFAAAVSTAVSLSFLAWYVPDFVSYQVPATISTNQSVVEEDGIDPLLARSIEERTVALYRQEQESTGLVFKDANFVTDAIIISSDGWIGFLDPGVAVPGLIALDASGQIHRIESRRTDTETGIVYAKLSDGNFLVSSIDTWQQTHRGASIWAHVDGAWEASTFDTPVALQGDTGVSLTEPVESYALSFEDGTPIYSRNGSFLGFVDGGELLPSWYVGNALTAILAKEAFYSPSVTYRGDLVRAYLDPLSAVYVDAPGILLTKIPPRTQGNTSTPQLGDVIVSVMGAPVEPARLAQYLATNETLRLTVLREDAYLPVVITQ